ncbi:MAG: hypothetical protein HY907_21585 [Deltaproteobacteria bacterium]|nr:hypothetical protein [Deltaproteobacteria bacterium]
MRTTACRLWVLLVVLGCGGGNDTEADVPGDADAVEAGADADADADVPFESGEAVGDAGEEDVSLPLVNQPICEGGTGSGTRRRWTDPVSGYTYCEATCRDCEAVCENDGTRSEGWYARCTDPGTDAGCGTAANLIVWANCM